MPNMGGMEIALVLAGLAIAVALLLALGRRNKRNTALDRWAADHGIGNSTDETRRIIHDYLSRGIKWRSMGGFIGFVVPLGTRVPGLEMMLGYLIAAILFELRSASVTRTTGHTAALVPRSIQDYVPRRPLMQFRVACSLAILTSIAMMVVPLRATVQDQPLGEAPWMVGVGVLLLWLINEVSLRVIAGRRQPTGSLDLVAADDALRSASMHAVLGAGIGIALLLFGASMLTFGLEAEMQLVRWVGPWLGLGGMILGIVSWLTFGPDTPWTVRRSGLASART